ncbi:unnamed protein product, partial [marine sediment metagenome]
MLLLNLFDTAYACADNDANAEDVFCSEIKATV